jgi:hypothetical protein
MAVTFPAGWVVGPRGGGIPPGHLRPCGCPGGPACQAAPEHRHGPPCGLTRFVATRLISVATDSDTGEVRRLDEGRIVCPRCVRPGPGEVATHDMDMTTGILTERG